MHANIGELAELFAVARSTISAWVKDGMPVVQAGRTGKEWAFHVADCMDWWAEHKYRRRPSARGAAEVGGPESYEEAERRRMVAQADKAELDLAKSSGQVVEIDDIAASVAEMHVNVRTRLLGIGNKVRTRAQSLFGGERQAEERVVAAIEQVVAEAMAQIRDDPFGEE